MHLHEYQAKEYYLAAVIDREEKRVVLIASQEGGVEIEEVAEKNQEAILTLPIYDDGRLRNFQGLILSQFMGCEKASAEAVAI